jgi:hypothetical protein
VLYGPSGVGKTSVLRAGVAHRLRSQARRNVEERGHPEFVVVVFDAWSEDPVGSLRAAVREELAAQFGSALLDEQEEATRDTFAGPRVLMRLAADPRPGGGVLPVPPGESGFAVDLRELVTRQGSGSASCCLRDDALAARPLQGADSKSVRELPSADHLDRRSATDAVLKPVERYNELAGESIEVEPELVEAVLDETAAGQVDLGAAGRVAVEEEAAGRIEAAISSSARASLGGRAGRRVESPACTTLASLAAQRRSCGRIFGAPCRS